MKIVEYFQSKGWQWSSNVGELNIVYFEDCTPDFLPSPQRIDDWNDMRVVFDHAGKLLFKTRATTEPGLESTNSKLARSLGGVFRIAIGQHLKCWGIGTHKRNDHPALVQRGIILGFRDFNKDGLRTNDKQGKGYGINQHGTRKGTAPRVVGGFSAGCLVGHVWEDHLAFISIVMSDIRYVNTDARERHKVRFDTTVIDTSDYHKWIKSQPVANMPLA